MRILSIDMGIRNLAFAVLGVYPGGSGGFGGSGCELDLRLDAWRRVSLPLDRGISVEEFGRYLDTPPGHDQPSLDSGTADAEDIQPKTKTKTNTNTKTKTKTQNQSENQTQSKEQENTKDRKEKEKKPPFYLPVYAAHAHSMLTTLLTRYRPTHVLIERQRFRSGGGAAVQEWSLRVGVFEGMLWAVLVSLRGQNLNSILNPSLNLNSSPSPGLSPDPLQDDGLNLGGLNLGCEGEDGGLEGSLEPGDIPRVISIDPSRVARFWAPASSSPSSPSSASSAKADDSEAGASKNKITTTTTSKSKNTSTNRESKKLKIDLAGSWLENHLFSIRGAGAEDHKDHNNKGKHKDKSSVQPWVDAYMAKWMKSTKAKSKSPKGSTDGGGGARKANSNNAAVDIGKLDDLADCLVQGMTWLEWEGAKGRIARDGVVVGGDVPA